MRTGGGIDSAFVQQFWLSLGNIQRSIQTLENFHASLPWEAVGTGGAADVWQTRDDGVPSKPRKQGSI